MHPYGRVAWRITTEHTHYVYNKFQSDTQSGIWSCLVRKVSAASGEGKVWDLLFAETLRVAGYSMEYGIGISLKDENYN